MINTHTVTDWYFRGDQLVQIQDLRKNHRRKFLTPLMKGIWRELQMARLSARGKDLFLVSENKPIGGDVISHIVTELRLKDNGNLLKRVRTYFKPGFLKTGKNFVSTGWLLEAKGIPLSPAQLLETLEQAGFHRKELKEE